MKLERVAEKIIELMSDNRITLSDWKYAIPFYMTKQPDHILVVTKNFADGINYQLDRNYIDIPPEFIVSYREDNMVYLNGKEYRGNKN
jgi:hypothetical protein